MKYRGSLNTIKSFFHGEYGEGYFSTTLFSLAIPAVVFIAITKNASEWVNNLSIMLVVMPLFVSIGIILDTEYHEFSQKNFELARNFMKFSSFCAIIFMIIKSI